MTNPTEIVARAIKDAHYSKANGDYFAEAEAAIAAYRATLSEAGYVVVKREPRKEDLRAAFEEADDGTVSAILRAYLNNPSLSEKEDGK